MKEGKSVAWVSSAEAAEITGRSSRSLYAHAMRSGWEFITAPPRSCGGNPGKMYKISDVIADRDARLKQDCRPSVSHEAECVRNWADGLERWPTESQIRKHVGPRMGYANVVSMVETRHARGKAELVNPQTGRRYVW